MNNTHTEQDDHRRPPTNLSAADLRTLSGALHHAVLLLKRFPVQLDVEAERIARDYPNIEAARIRLELAERAEDAIALAAWTNLYERTKPNGHTPEDKGNQLDTFIRSTVERFAEEENWLSAVTQTLGQAFPELDGIAEVAAEVAIRARRLHARITEPPDRRADEYDALHVYKPSIDTTEKVAAGGAKQEDARKAEDARHDGPDLSILTGRIRPAPAFPLDVLGPFWSKWCREAAEGAAAPVDYVIAPLLASASVLIGHARWARVVPGWEEAPHLWCASVGESGSSKSPGADPLLKHVLPVLERRMMLGFSETLAAWHTTKQVAEAKEKEWKRAVDQARQNNTEPPTRPLDSFVPPEPQAPCITLQDVTIEKVAAVLADLDKGVLMVRDELAAFLIGMNQYNLTARQFWLEAYGSRGFKVDRVKNAQRITIERFAVGWWGTIQPARLGEVFAAPDDGMTSRFLWFWPDPVRFDLASQQADMNAALTYLAALHALCLESPSAGLPGQKEEDATPKPVYLTLSEQARGVIKAFAQEAEAEQRVAHDMPLFKSALGKARGQAVRIALILEHLWWCSKAARGEAPRVVSVEAVEAACLLMRVYFLPMASRVFGEVETKGHGYDPTHNAEPLARQLAGVIVKHGLQEVHVRNLLRKRGTLPKDLRTSERLREAAKVLIEAGWLEQPPAGGGNKAGAPRLAFPVVPAVWPLVAEWKASGGVLTSPKGF